MASKTELFPENETKEDLDFSTDCAELNTACIGDQSHQPLEEDGDNIEKLMAMEEFEFELDEHCDFTLMQFSQASSQLLNRSNITANTSSTQAFVKKPTPSSHTNIPKKPPIDDQIPVELMQDTEFPGFSQAFTPSQFDNSSTFYGLPDKVKKLIQDHKGISKLYDWQDECLSLPAVKDHQNLIYALPTSSGKTLVAEILIFRELVCRKRDVLFILPFVSIVKEKIAALAPFAVDLDFYLEEYAAGQGVCPPRQRHNKNSVYIATIEKSLALVDSLTEVNRLSDIGLVVVDELHLLGEPGRGAILETVLTKVKWSAPAAQIIGMSATIGNLPEIQTFLNAEIYRQEFRPVELKEYIKCGGNWLAVEKNPIGETIFVPIKREDAPYDDEMYNKLDPDRVGALVMEVAPKHALLIFCPVKKNCQDVAMNLARVLRQ